MIIAAVLLAARLAAAEAPADAPPPDEELDVVAGPTKVTRARAALYQSLRDRGIFDQNGGAVLLKGTTVKYWKGCGLPDYQGAIEGLPSEVIEYLLSIGAIKSN